jgi:hypothetical protein
MLLILYFKVPLSERFYLEHGGLLMAAERLQELGLAHYFGIYDTGWDKLPPTGKWLIWRSSLLLPTARVTSTSLDSGVMRRSENGFLDRGRRA